MEEAKQARTEAQPLLFLRMHAAECELRLGNVAKCKMAIDGAKQELEVLSDVRNCPGFNKGQSHSR